VPDLAEYTKDRGFYFDYDAYACGDVITERGELAAAVLRASADDSRMAAFKKKFVPLCDGQSCRRFAEEILKG